MKRLLLAVLLTAAAAAFADDLVEAAKAAKAKRKKSTTKVITNADVKKAKATLVENKVPLTPLEPVSQETMLEKQARERKEQESANVLVSAAQASVTSLEKELLALEHQYYEENNPDLRDSELVRRFNEVRTRLGAARKDLEALVPPLPQTPGVAAPEQ